MFYLGYSPAQRRARAIELADGGTVPSLAFLADTRHLQYAGKLAIAEQVRIVRRGVGESGGNPEYVLETARKLHELGISDRYLDDVVAALNGFDVPVVAGA